MSNKFRRIILCLLIIIALFGAASFKGRLVVSQKTFGLSYHAVTDIEDVFVASSDLQSSSDKLLEELLEVLAAVFFAFSPALLDGKRILMTRYTKVILKLKLFLYDILSISFGGHSPPFIVAL